MSDKRVVIIGAGPTGLGAGYRLKQEGRERGKPNQNDGTLLQRESCRNKYILLTRYIFLLLPISYRDRSMPGPSV